jgi:trans-aconitate methyltransferase
MYSEIAEWWPLLSPPEEYEEEASFYIRTILDASDERPRSLLELGSGGGNNASFMKKEFTLTLVDLSPEMLALSRTLNPECEHVEGDMRTVRLQREFDAVFIHDAINYMTTTEDLEAALRTALVHVRRGGVALFCPDHTRETFVATTDHGGGDDGSKGMRYLEWVWDPDPTDMSYIADYAYMLRDEDGEVRVLHDRHEEGLFAQSDWREVLGRVGFEPTVVPFTHSDIGHESVVFVGKKPR